MLFNFLIAIGISVIDMISGWWFLLVLIPLLGALILLVFFIMDSNEAGAQYGPARK